MTRAPFAGSARRITMSAVFFIAAAVALIAPATPAAAFDTDLSFGGALAFQVGYTRLDLSGLSDYLDPAGIDAFDDGYLSFGGELRGFVFQRLTFGFSGSAFHDEKSGPLLDADLTGSQFLFDVGFVLFDTHRVRGYPIVGIGAGGVAVNLEGNYTGLPLASQAGLEYVPFTQNERDGYAVIAGRQDVGLDYTAFTGTIGFNLDWYYPFVGDPSAFALVMTGLRVGVTGEIASSGWQVDGRDLDGSNPDFAFNTAFANLAFGFGGGTNYMGE